MNVALSPEGGADEPESIEDRINQLIESKKMLTNASYFAFTATPKSKTIELFGQIVPGEVEEQGQPKRRAFHSYTMKQRSRRGSSSTSCGTTRPSTATTAS